MIAGVTGASGFIGTAFVDMLLRRGWSVRSLARRPAPKMPFNAKLETCVTGPLETAQNLSETLKGCHTVYHLAGKAHAHKSETERDDAFEGPNCVATARLAEGALNAGCQRFVFISSIKVHGETSDGRAPFSPTDRLSPQGAYARSKLKAEQLLKDVGESRRMTITTVRPSLVIGPEPKGNLDRLGRLVESGVPLPFGALANRRSLLGLDNLCDLLVHLGTARALPDMPLLAHDLTLSTPEIIRRSAKSRGIEPKLFPVPSFVLRPVFAALGRRADAARLIGSMEIAADALPRGLGWMPDPARNPLS